MGDANSCSRGRWRSVKLYLIAIEIFSFQGSTPNIQFDVALIGTAPWGGSFWSGNIDEVAYESCTD